MAKRPQPLIDIGEQYKRADHLAKKIQEIPGTTVETRKNRGGTGNPPHVEVVAALPASLAKRIGQITRLDVQRGEGRLMIITLPMDLMGMDINSQPETVDGYTIDRGAAMKAIETELGLYKKTTQTPVEALMR